MEYVILLGIGYMKRFLIPKIYYYVFYDKSFGRGGQECRGFYYKNENDSADS